MEQRETEQRNGTNGIEMERILAWHGYHSPVPVGEGSFSQVYRVTDSSGEFRACRVSDVTEQWQRECENWQEIKKKYCGRIKAAYGCSLGGSSVSLLIQRKRIHITWYHCEQRYR